MVELNTRPTARLLDLSRLISRVGRGPFTGVDRVEAAYLTRLLADDLPLFALVRSSIGYTIFDRTGVEALASRLLGQTTWGRRDGVSRLFLRASRAHQAAESDLRRLAAGWSRPFGLARMIAKNIAPGYVWIAVGHANLRAEAFNAVRTTGGRSVVLIHDTIPLDYPDWQRLNTVGMFRERIALVAQHADLVIHSAQTTREMNERHLSEMGRVPDGITAHLGINRPPLRDKMEIAELSQDRPYFVVLGTIEPRKNHALLLDVWTELATRLPTDQMPTLCIVGSRGWKNEAVFARLNARPKHIVELRDLPDTALGSLLSKARALLMPSFVEGYGLPPGEALALGCPVIAADLPVYHEVFGNNPVYLDPRDLYSWADKIQAVAQQTDRPKTETFVPPTWEEHFNIVLKVI